VKAKFHEELKIKAGFPDYYGKNWDALFDMLTDEKFSNMSLLIADYDFLAEGLGCEEAQKLLKVLEDAASREGTLFEYSLLSNEENPNFNLPPDSPKSDCENPL
jgi:RNAse (barnase) inhibitor barstar